MFENPLYNLFIRPAIKKKFTITESIFSDHPERPYLIIKDNPTGNGALRPLKLSNVNYDVIDSHLTIPKFQDQKEGFFSAYHHTLYLKDDKHNNFVIHIYFDRFDQYCTHPSPSIKFKSSIETMEGPTLIPLSSEDITTIFSCFVIHTVSKIKFIRTQQRAIISNLREMLTRAQKVISPELEGSLEHLSNLEFQVQILSNIGVYELPSSNAFNGDKDADGFMIPNTQKHRLALERILEAYRAKTAPLPVIDEDNQEKQGAICTEDLIATRITQKQAQVEAQQKEEQKQYHDFVTQYKQSVDNFVNQNNDQKQKNRALRHLCELEKVAPSFNETQHIDHDELFSLRFKCQQLLKEYCNTLDETNYRGKVDVLLQLNLDNYLTEETVSALTLRAITDGDTRILTILLSRFSIPILQQHTMPTLPATANVANTTQHTLLEWSVQLNKPKCFGLLLKYGHRLEYFYQANSPVRAILCDLIDGEEFLKELISHMMLATSANAKKTLFNRELSILQQQIDDAHSNANIERLTQLKRQMSLTSSFIDLGETIQKILRKVPQAITQGASQQFLVTGCSMIRNISTELRTQLRQDEDFSKLIMAQCKGTVEWLTLLDRRGDRGASLKNVLMCSNQIMKTAEIGDIPLTKAILFDIIRYSTNKIRLLIEFDPKILSFNKEGHAIFAKQNDADRYNKAFTDLETSFTRSVKQQSLQELKQQLAEILADSDSSMLRELIQSIDGSGGGEIRLAF